MGTNFWNSRQEDRTFVRRRSVAIIAGLGVATAGLVAVDMRAYQGTQQDELALAESLPSIDFSQGGGATTPSSPAVGASVNDGSASSPTENNPNVSGSAQNNGDSSTTSSRNTPAEETSRRTSRLRVTETTSASRPISVGETLPPGLKRPKIVPAPYVPPTATTRPQPSTPGDQPAVPDTSTPPADPAPGTPDTGTPGTGDTGDTEPPTTTPSQPDVGEPVTPTPEEPTPTQPEPVQPEPSQPEPTQPVPTEEPAKPTPAPTVTVAPKPRFMFGSCKQAWSNGVGMLHRGGFGWNPALDTDGNGTACERPPTDLLNP